MLDETKLKRYSSLTGENNPRFGAKISVKMKQHLHKKLTGRPSDKRGKTFIEMYGEERVTELAKQHSEKLFDGFRSGRINVSTGNTSRGIICFVDGVRLKSTYEAKFFLTMKRKGYIYGKDFFYEPQELRIPYIDSNGKERTYIPDFMSFRRRPSMK